MFHVKAQQAIVIRDSQPRRGIQVPRSMLAQFPRARASRRDPVFVTRDSEQQQHHSLIPQLDVSMRLT
jgi:hypothetical protein